MMRHLLLVTAAWLAIGCAREEYAPNWPAPPPVAYPYPYPYAYAGAPQGPWRPPSGPRSRKRRPSPHPGEKGERSLYIPDGAACLDWLNRHGIRYQVLRPKPGMTTPVEITGPIGGITYETAGDAPLVCDCRLAVALHWAAPELHALGVSEIHHAGAYAYRTTKKGRLSLHALGLAIDVRNVRAWGKTWSVKRNYYAGLADDCAPTSPELNRIACQLGRLDLFRELLTPDYDRDHRDHLHLAIAPL